MHYSYKVYFVELFNVMELFILFRTTYSVAYFMNPVTVRASFHQNMWKRSFFLLKLNEPIIKHNINLELIKISKVKNNFLFSIKYN